MTNPIRHIGRPAAELPGKPREGLYRVLDYRLPGDGLDWSLAVTRASKQARADKIAGAISGAVVEMPPFAIQFMTQVPLTWWNGGTREWLDTVRFVGNGSDSTEVIAGAGHINLFSGFMEVGDPAGFFNSQWLQRKIGFEGMTFDMDYDTWPDDGVLNPLPDPVLGLAADNFQMPIFLYYCDEAWVRYCKFVRCWYNGIELYTVNRGRVEHNDFINVADKSTYIGFYTCVEIDGRSASTKVLHNNAKNVGSFVNGNGDNANFNPDGRVATEMTTITENDVEDVQIGAISIIDNFDEVDISKNKLRRMKWSGISVRFTQAAINNARGPRNVKVLHNQITDWNLDRLNGQLAIEVHAIDPIVQGNIMKNAVADNGGNSFYGILARQYIEKVATVDSERTGATICDNTLIGNFANGYAIFSLAKDSLITGNRGRHTGTANAQGGVSAAAAGSAERDNAILNAIRLDDAIGAVRVERMNSPGDNSITLTAGTDATTQVFGGLTTNRNVSLNTVGAKKGDRFRIVQAVTTPWAIDINAGMFVMIPNYPAWCDVEYDGAAWKVTGYGGMKADRVNVAGATGSAGYYIANNLILREPAPNIPGPTGGTVIDAPNRAVTNQILSMLSGWHHLMQP